MHTHLSEDSNRNLGILRSGGREGSASEGMGNKQSKSHAGKFGTQEVKPPGTLPCPGTKHPTNSKDPPLGAAHGSGRVTGP